MTALKDILLVDDDPASREIGKLCLERGGFKVITCSSGAQALDQIAVQRPQLLLLDIVMPDIDGIMLMGRIRRLYGPTFPIAFITSRVLPEQLSVYRQSGALGVIAKPFRPGTINDEVATLWAQWLASVPATG